MDRSVPEAPRVAANGGGPVVLRALALAAVLLALEAHAGEPLVPLAGARYVNRELGFMVDVPAGMTACQRPREGWREGIVLVLGRGAGCARAERAAAFVVVTGEPNTEALGDVESLAAGLCTHASWGEVRVGPAPRAIDTLPTLVCMIQAENGSVAIEVMAQNVRNGPPATWTNLRVSLIAPGDRWPEFARSFEDVIGRVRRLP
jgi:hypothetical protein